MGVVSLFAWKCNREVRVVSHYSVHLIVVAGLRPLPSPPKCAVPLYYMLILVALHFEPFKFYLNPQNPIKIIRF